MAEDKHDTSRKSDDADGGASTQCRDGTSGGGTADGKPAGVGPVDKKEEVEQQPT